MGRERMCQNKDPCSADVSDKDVIFLRFVFYLEPWNTNDVHAEIRSDTDHCLRRLPSLPPRHPLLLMSPSFFGQRTANDDSPWYRLGEENVSQSIHIAEPPTYKRTRGRQEAGWCTRTREAARRTPSLCSCATAGDKGRAKDEMCLLLVYHDHCFHLS